MDKRNNSAILQFLKRFWSPCVLIFALLAIVGFRGIHLVFNPPDGNKIVLSGVP
jgi:hypothetical protein